MKKFNLLGLVFLPAIFGLALSAGLEQSAERVSAEEPAHQFFSTDAGESTDFGSLTSLIGYQGEDGVRLYSGNVTSKNYLNKDTAKWISDESATKTVVEAGLVVPGKNGFIYEWVAPKTGTYLIKGMIYNHFAFTSQEDLSGFGVAPREAMVSSTRDGVTVKTALISSYSYNYSGDYDNLVLTSDFSLFVDTHYYVLEGDKLTIEISGNSDFTNDEVGFYFGIDYSDKIVDFKFNQPDLQINDSLGTSNHVCVNEGAVVKVDSEKGIHFNAGLDDDNASYYYDQLCTGTDFTDYLTEFSIHVRFTIEGSFNDWSYIFSTTSHENDQSTRGLALMLNAMGATNSAGKAKYCLQLRVDEAGDTAFFSVANGWTNDIVDGGTYDVFVNCSSLNKKIETFCTGPYNDGWIGTNANGTGATTLENTWTMMNPGSHALTLGCFNEAGEQPFHGYISEFEITNSLPEFPQTEAGPFRAQGAFANSIKSVAEVASVDYNADVATMLSAVPTTVAITLDNDAVVNEPVTWDATPIITANEAYFVGHFNNSKYVGKGVTVKCPINAAVVTLVEAGEYTTTIYELGAANNLPTSKTNYDIKYFTDKELTQEFTGDTFTSSLKLYVSDSAVEYTITYHLDGGVNGQNPTSFTVEDEDITLLDATKEGYVFLGWYEEVTFDNKITVIDTNVGKNLDVYAKFEEIVVYTITYHLDGGVNNDANPTQFIADDGEIVLANPTKEGYEFKGWYLEETFEHKVLTIDPSTAQDYNLYAKWEKIVTPEPVEEQDEPTQEQKKGCFGSITCAFGFISILSGAAVALLVDKKSKLN